MRLKPFVPGVIEGRLREAADAAADDGVRTELVGEADARLDCVESVFWIPRGTPFTPLNSCAPITLNALAGRYCLRIWMPTLLALVGSFRMFA